MRRITLVTAVAALLAAPAGAHAQDGSHVAKASLFGLSPLALSTVPGIGENLEYLGGANTFTGGHSVIEGDRLYVGAYGLGMRVFDISEPASPVELGTITRDGARADTPPDAIDVGGRKLAVLNGTNRTGGTNQTTTTRTEWFDVTDPSSPTLLSQFVGATDGESHNGDIVDKRRIWIPSGGSGENGLRIYDITPTLRTDAESCETVANVSDASDGSGNPCAPVKLFTGNPGTLWEDSPHRGDKPVGEPFTHTHDVEIYTDYPVAGRGERDIMLLAEGGNYIGNGDTGSAFVIDITDPTDPEVLYRWLHEPGADHHPIQYHHEIQFVDGMPGLALVTDEDLHNGCGSAGGVVALQFAPDLQSATELSEWFIPAGTPAPVCSVHVFSSRDGFVALGSYNAGLQIVDYRDPANPQQAAWHIAPGATAWGALIHGDIIYVGDMSRGLDVFRFSGFPESKGKDREKRPKGKP